MEISEIIDEVQERIQYFSTVATDIISSAQTIHSTREDPYEAHKVLIQGQKVQELAAEYMKLAAQLHCVSLAHKAAEKAGYSS